MAVTVRFAPSPTGRLHVGNIRTALLNWLFAKTNDGRFVLRLDDTDTQRSTIEFAQGIETDLKWLGIEWDELARQSDRLEHYDQVAEELKAAGRLYPAYETPDELEVKRKRQRARGLPPVYDRAALKLSADERSALEAEGRKPHWRFKLETRDVAWSDLVRGEQHVDAGSLSDPVLVREDGSYLYTLPSVVDDIDLGISHVIRGEDHVVNTAVQIQIFEALGAQVPAFGHHNLLVAGEGQTLSKREGSLSISSFRDEGYEPAAVASYAVLTGSSDAIEAKDNLQALAEGFDLGKISRSPARFEAKELLHLNAELLHRLPYEAVASRLEALGIGGGRRFWEGVKGNLQVLPDAAEWWKVVAEPLAPVIEDAALCAKAAALLPPEPWSPDVFDGSLWQGWLDQVKAETGAKGKGLFQPLRLALTGRDHGPELKALLFLMGRERAERRLRGETA